MAMEMSERRLLGLWKAELEAGRELGILEIPHGGSPGPRPMEPREKRTRYALRSHGVANQDWNDFDPRQPRGARGRFAAKGDGEQPLTID
jgi:hypothetical protein